VFRFPRGVKAHEPASLTEEQAQSVGESFVRILHFAATPAAAVDEFIRLNGVVQALVLTHVWFRPMLETMAKRALQNSFFGRRLRVGMAAALALANVAADVSFSFRMFVNGELLAALAMVGAFVIATVIQVFIVVINHRHRGGKRVMYETFFVVSLVKPVVEASRLASNMRNILGAPLTVMEEASYSNAVRMVCGSIPAAIIKLVSMLGSRNGNLLEVFSFVISCVGIAFTSASMVYDADTDPANRNSRPWFYGMIGDTHPSLVFILMVVTTALHVSAKTLCSSLLSLTDLRWLAVYVSADMAIFLLYKVVRRDFYTWVPGFGVALSLAYRLISKLLGDFTGLVDLRHSNEFGGGYFTANAALTQAACFMAAAVYSESYRGDKIDRSTLFTVVGSLAALWAMSFGGLLLAVERKHVRSFISLQTGREDTMRYFTDNEGNDERRVMIFEYNERHWRPIKRDVKQWVRSRYAIWVRDSPSWFDEALSARIPASFLPKAVVAPEPEA
jgi:hypothetical protein